MAEGFLDLIPRHDMIKFCKNGSTATTAAVKLARAYTGRELIAFQVTIHFILMTIGLSGKQNVTEVFQIQLKNYQLHLNLVI